MSQVSAASIRHVLGDLRRRLQMDVALVSHFEGGRRVIDILDSDEAVPFGPGDSTSRQRRCSTQQPAPCSTSCRCAGSSWK